jgi:hypothetical protein
MVLGLVFGAGAVTWAFSGMLSMDPFPERTNRPVGGGPQIGRGVDPNVAERIPGALRGRAPLEAFAGKHPSAALAELGNLPVTDLELTSFASNPVYLATLANGDTRVVPVDGDPVASYPPEWIEGIVRKVAGPSVAEIRMIDQYDRYYLDRRRERPLPVLLLRLNDPQQTRYYIDPKTARIVGGYNASNWMSRWAYHGLHSLDFPWLYNYRPLWDIVVITFMVGGTALCVTSLVLAWRVLGRTLRGLLPAGAPRASPLNEDLA